MFAIIKTGGKQYRVEPGQVLRIEKLGIDEGKPVEFAEVLLLSDKDATIGQPFIPNAKVTATVVSNGQAKKVTGVKFHNKVRYKRTFGHRQEYTQVKIEKISA